MKKYYLPMMLLLVISTAFSIVPGNEDLIKGVWKVHPDYLRNTTQAVINETRKTNSDLADQMEANFDAVQDMVGGIEVTYKDDHLYEVQTPQGIQKGTWQIVDDGHSLVINIEGRPSRKDSIVELTGERLVLINRRRGDTTLFVHP